MTAALVTLQNAPRDLQQIMAMSRAIRFRLALNMKLFETAEGSDSTEVEKAFTTSGTDVQSEAILKALLKYDQDSGVAAPSQHPPAITPKPIAASPGVLKPTALIPSKEAALSRAPQTSGDPANKGSATTAPAASTPTGDVSSAQMLAVIGKVWDTMGVVAKDVENLKTLQNERAEDLVSVISQLAHANAKLIDVQSSLEASKKVQDLLLGLVVEMAQAQMGLDRGSMVKLAAIAAEEALELITGAETEGK